MSQIPYDKSGEVLQLTSLQFIHLQLNLASLGAFGSSQLLVSAAGAIYFSFIDWRITCDTCNFFSRGVVVSFLTLSWHCCPAHDNKTESLER